MTHHTEDDNPDQRYKRGYDTTHLPIWLQKWLKEAHNSNLPAHLFEAVITIASIPAVAVLFLVVANRILSARDYPVLSVCGVIVSYVIACMVIARQQRGIELMTHDASHRVWYPQKRWINDLLADVLVAYPVLSSIESYWSSHRIHHMHYGSHGDPCRQRFAAMGLEYLDLSTRWKIICAVVQWLPSYNKAYYEEIGSLSLKRWGLFVLWHSLFMFIPSSVGIYFWMDVSPLNAMFVGIVAWFVFWMFPAFVFLPVLRSIAESEEHDYAAGSTEFETTFTNTWLFHQLFIHPKGDAYHLIHHMFPRITERRHKHVHELLMKYDYKYKGALHRSNMLGVK